MDDGKTSLSDSSSVVMDVEGGLMSFIICYQWSEELVAFVFVHLLIVCSLPIPMDMQWTEDRVRRQGGCENGFPIT